MKPFSIGKSLASAVPILVASVAIAGCHSHDDETVVAALSDTYWYLSYEEIYETEERDFFWDSSLAQGDVEFRVTNFHNGTIRVRIYDDLGVEIYDEFAFDHHHHYHDYDDEITIFGTTGPANPGTWRIRVSSIDFTGHLYLTISEP